MGKCIFCHKDAGLFKSEHEQCRQQYESDCAQLKRIIESCFASKIDFYTKATEINTIMSRGMISDDSKKKLYTQFLDNAVENYLNDGVIDDNEYRTITRFIQFSGVPQNVINANHSLDKVVQAQVLNEILSGKVPAQRFSVAGGFPFMLEKSETPIWLFRNVTLHEQKTIRQTVGRHSGFNIRVMKGVYYRTGGFKGTPVDPPVSRQYLKSCGTSSLKIFHLLSMMVCLVIVGNFFNTDNTLSSFIEMSPTFSLKNALCLIAYWSIFTSSFR